MTPKRLRSTAFALLAKREHSQKELSEKLISYGADANDVAALMREFADKNYQSDTRMTGVLMRHTIKKGQGIKRLKHALGKHNLSTDAIANELRAVNWLAEAIRVRQKRFGSTLPTQPKEKAKQLRFLLYRGFDNEICYKALRTNDADS